MNIWRLCIIVTKVMMCFPMRGRYLILRITFLPLHLLFYPHIVFQKNGYRIKSVLESLGVVFIKLGQSLSLKSFLFDKQTLAILSSLQDSIPPINLNIIEHITKINKALAQNSSLQIDEKPIACASVAQVYAGFIDGKKIAIKVLKPNAQKQIHDDFKILALLGKIASVFCSPVLQINEVIQNVYENILTETNFSIEAKNLETIRRNVILDDGVKIPKIFLEYSNAQMLVMSYEKGISIKEIINGKTNYNRRKIAENIIYLYLKQVYRDGIFHADMHAGNILVKDDLTLVLLDFGLICKIDNTDRRAVATMIYAFTNKNVSLVLETQLKAGYISQEIFINPAYKKAMEKLALNFVEQKEFKMSDFTRELFLSMDKFHITVPKKLLLLNKTMIYIEDISRQLDSSFNPFSIINPWIKNWYRKEKITIMTSKFLHFIRSMF